MKLDSTLTLVVLLNLSLSCLIIKHETPSWPPFIVEFELRLKLVVLMSLILGFYKILSLAQIVGSLSNSQVLNSLSKWKVAMMKVSNKEGG